MYIEKFKTAAGSKITVTATATGIFDLINTAESLELNNAGFSSGVNALLIQPEDGDVRILFDGNAPTASNGYLVASGGQGYFPNVPLKALRLIRAGSANVACSIMVGKSTAGESIAISGAGGGGSSTASSSGSAGGGNNTYSTEQGDFTAAVTNATTNIVLSTDSVGGVALDENNFANGILKVWDASTEEMITITLDDFTWTAATKTLAVANCTGTFTFATGDLVSLTVVGPDKMADKLNNAQYSNPIRDLSDNTAGDTLADITNETDATSYYYLDVEGYSEAVVQFEKTGGTDTVAVTVEATAQNDGTADSSCTYKDITQYGADCLTAAAAASFADDVALRISCKGLKFIRIKVAVTISASDLDYTIYSGRAY